MKNRFEAATAVRLILIAGFVTCASASYASFVVPRSMENVSGGPGEGTTGFYGIGQGDSRLYQYAASELAAQGLAIGDSIVGVRARSSSFAGFGTAALPAADMTWSDFTIKLAQATNTIANMSTTADLNMTNPMTVRTGPFTLPAGSLPGGSGLHDFGYLMTFTTPYIYQGGDLTFYFTHSAATGGTTTQDAPNSFTGIGTLYRSLFGGTVGPGIFNNVMTVLKFETVAIPEPTTTVLLGIGAIAFISRRSSTHRCYTRAVVPCRSRNRHIS